MKEKEKEYTLEINEKIQYKRIANNLEEILDCQISIAKSLKVIEIVFTIILICWIINIILSLLGLVGTAVSIF